MGSERFSGRKQSIGCALAWVTIARDSESEHAISSTSRAIAVLPNGPVFVIISAQIGWNRLVVLVSAGLISMDGISIAQRWKEEQASE